MMMMTTNIFACIYDSDPNTDDINPLVIKQWIYYVLSDGRKLSL
jgi:hypothetical protein